MGIDVISWFGGSLQSQMGEEDWLGVMKLRAYKAAAEEAAPGDPGSVVLKIRQEDGTSTSVSYGELVAALDAAARDAGDCAPCFESDSPCHRFISFPIDEMAERLLFNYFLRELETPNSPGDQIYRDLIAGHASVRPAWERRGAGEESTLEAADPFHETITRHGGVTIDSSQVFGALFSDVRGVEAVTAYALFWHGFREFVPAVLASRSRSLGELVSLPALFDHTFRRKLEGAESCAVLFFV